MPYECCVCVCLASRAAFVRLSNQNAPIQGVNTHTATGRPQPNLISNEHLTRTVVSVRPCCSRRLACRRNNAATIKAGAVDIVGRLLSHNRVAAAAAHSLDVMGWRRRRRRRHTVHPHQHEGESGNDECRCR